MDSFALNIGMAEGTKGLSKNHPYCEVRPWGQGYGAFHFFDDVHSSHVKCVYRWSIQAFPPAGFRFQPMWSAGPNTYVRPSLDTELTESQLGGRRLSIWHTLPVDASALITLFKPDFLASIGDMWFRQRDHSVSDGWENPVLPDPQSGRWFFSFLERLLLCAQKNWWPRMRTRPENGSIGVKLEASGKIRVFAIVNPILQTLLRPLHDWCMSILWTLPTDGTYEQLAPQGKSKICSFDLKAATYSLPLKLSACVLRGIFGDDLFQSRMDIMSNTAFRVHKSDSPIRRRAHVYRLTLR